MDTFKLDLKTLTVTIPDDVATPSIASVGELVVKFTPGSGQTQELKYHQEGKPSRNMQTWTYTFIPVGHAGVINYHPGDKLTAELAARSIQKDYRLVWSAGRSNWYQQDNLGQPPRLDTDPAVGVQLLTSNGALTGPSLLPNLR